MEWICTDEVRYRWETRMDDTCSWQVEMCPTESSDGRLWWVLVLRETYADDGSETLGDVYDPIQRVTRVALPTERICRFAIDEVVRGVYDPFETGGASIVDAEVSACHGPETGPIFQSDGMDDDAPADPYDAMMADFLAYCEHGRSHDGEGADKRKRKKSDQPKRGQTRIMLRVFDADGSRLYGVKLSRAEQFASDLMSVLPAEKCDKGVRLTRPLAELGLTKSQFMEGCKAVRKGRSPSEVFGSLRRSDDS